MRIALKASVNSKYVCAEKGGGRELIANRDVANIWEHFEVTLHFTQPPLVSGNQISLQCYKGQYVCAEGGGGQQLIANRPWNSTWEIFRITKARAGNIANGDDIFLQSANGQYVCAENAGNGPLIPNRNAAGLWETFKVEIDDRIPLQDSELNISTNAVGVVFALNDALTKRLVAAAGDLDALKRALTAAIPAAYVATWVTIVIGLVALHIQVEAALIKLVNKGNGVYLTIPWPAITLGLWGLIVPTSR